MKEVRLEDIRALPQRLRPAQRLALDLAISATLALTLVAWASTVPLTYSVFKGMRNMVLMPSIIFCFLFLLPKIRSRLFLLGACLWLLLVLYAFLLSNLTHSASLTSSTEVLLFFVIVVIFFFFLSLSKDEVISDRAMTIIFFFILGVFIFTANAQGFLWGTPPVFVFSAETFGSESNLSYSLGASRFYGLGAVTAAIMWGKQKKTDAAGGISYRISVYVGSVFDWWRSGRGHNHGFDHAFQGWGHPHHLYRSAANQPDFALCWYLTIYHARISAHHSKIYISSIFRRAAGYPTSAGNRSSVERIALLYYGMWLFVFPAVLQIELWPLPP